ncbi:NCS1 family nucleobase:cation symporter-1 [Sinomonas albida]|uniref:NCS1 family nucleobase:cation symporter-1 n=1 Tax=Sinomonas albida TaxID=369942 RepID=UPI0010A8F9E2|nr:NCS1 family nucleobase:cation symporter-1 [Sinomonas albida]
MNSTPDTVVQPLKSPLNSPVTLAAEGTAAPSSDDAAARQPDRDPRLSNKDLDPLKHQKWGSYNIFAFWMSDVHSVGGYVTAGSLFALGLASWQVLVSLIVGILIVQFFCNLVAKPSQVTGVPYPVVNRAIFGVRGANIPAVIRGLIAIAWYGVQTYLASQSLVIVMLKFWPQLAPLAVNEHGFLGLSPLGYVAYALLWVAQGLVFWRGMEAIKRFVDWAGPAVYVVMILLAVYLVSKAGWDHVSLNLSAGKPLDFGASIPVMISAVALVVSYFSGPMLNFGDFSRYAKSFKAVKKGNLLGLPVNFLFFSLLTVLTASATVPVFGELITDPIETVSRIDAPFATILGGLTFVIATVGINIVANFISPAFDFSHVNPQKISWRMGGMIAAVGSVILTPWNWYSNATAIQWSLGILGALIGPLFGILIAGYFVVSKQRIWVEDMYTMSPKGRYWFVNGVNPNAVAATLISGLPAIASVILPTILGQAQWISDYSWFIGCGLGFVAFTALERSRPRIQAGEPEPATAA